MQTRFGCEASRRISRTIRRRRRRRTTLLKRSSGRSGCYDVADGRWKRICRVAVAKRLRALRRLIPAKEEDTAPAAAAPAASDRLFEETADYILLLRTQVEVLKRLVDLYSPCVQTN